MKAKAIAILIVLALTSTGFLSIVPSSEATGPVKWYMHIDHQGDSGLDLIFNQAANQTGPYDAALDVADDTVDALIAKWETAAFAEDTDVSGTWTFSLDMWEDDDVIEGAVYAKVYADTTLLNITPDETLADIANDNTSGGTTVSWTSTLPHPTIISTGEQIIVEYWFDSTAGGSSAGGLPYSEFVVDGSDTGGSEDDMGPGDDSATNDFDDGSGDVMDVRWTYDISEGTSDINVTYDVDSWDAGEDNLLLQWSNDNSTWNDLTPSSSTVDQDNVDSAITSGGPSYVHIESMAASGSGTLSSLGFYLSAVGSEDTYVRLAVYADASGVPAGAAPLAETDLLNVNGLGPGWVDIPTNETPAISSSTQYWISSSMSQMLGLPFNRSGNTPLYYKSSTFPALPSDAGAWSSGSVSYSRSTRMSYGTDGIAAGSTDVNATVDLSDESITFDSTFYLRSYVSDNGGSTVQTAEIDQLYIDIGIFGGAIASDEFVVDGSDTGGSEDDMGPGDDSATNDFDDGSGDVMDVRWTYDISEGTSDINVTYDVDSWDAGEDNLLLQWSNDNSTWNDLTPSSSTVDQDNVVAALTSQTPSYVHIEPMAASSSGTLSSLGFYMTSAGTGSSFVRLALYADASGVPAGAAPLAETDLLNVNGLGPGWIDIPTNETPAISSSTQYWIASSMSDGLYFDINRSDNSGSLYYKASTFPALPSDAGAWSSGSDSYLRATRMSYGTDGIAAGSTDATATADLSAESITFDSTFYLRAYVPDNGGSTVQTVEIDQLYIDIGIIGGGSTHQIHLGYDSTGLSMDSWVQIPLAAPDVLEPVHMSLRWTLFSLSVFNTTGNLSASDIFALVAAEGGTAQIMTWWEPGVGYHSYTGTTGDFEVKIGHAYWVYLDEGGSMADIELYGLDRTDYEAWDLVNGDGPGGDGTADGKLTVPLVAGEYNLLGWFNDTTVPVSDFINATADGYYDGVRGLVAYWDNAAREYGPVAIQLSPGTTTTKSWTVAPETGYWASINTATTMTY